MFAGCEILAVPMFVRSRRWYSWNADGKCIWGGDTLEQVLTDDPDGPVRYVAQRTDWLSWDYQLFEVVNGALFPWVSQGHSLPI
jgi:hypothetical protein